MSSSSTSLYVARLDSRPNDIVGTITLVIYRIPSGIDAVIEDVIVDESARDHGVGHALVSRVVEIARSRGARHITLTFAPSQSGGEPLVSKGRFLQTRYERLPDRLELIRPDARGKRVSFFPGCQDGIGFFPAAASVTRPATTPANPAILSAKGPVEVGRCSLNSTVPTAITYVVDVTMFTGETTAAEQRCRPVWNRTRPVTIETASK